MADEFEGDDDSDNSTCWVATIFEVKSMLNHVKVAKGGIVVVEMAGSWIEDGGW
ncbi:hypothetical protein TWF694_000067 [Orbilia ellipsospora]|uniref:Uncharacterized protein n=1 Tax=Orbilia ellipsospora TaxID=2528407 RepID=A0AAV9XMX3_9PEZI